MLVGFIRGNRQKEMEIPVIRMCDGDIYASYEGRYGVGGDIYVAVAFLSWKENSDTQRRGEEITARIVSPSHASI